MPGSYPKKLGNLQNIVHSLLKSCYFLLLKPSLAFLFLWINVKLWALQFYRMIHLDFKIVLYTPRSCNLHFKWTWALSAYIPCFAFLKCSFFSFIPARIFPISKLLSQKLPPQLGLFSHFPSVVITYPHTPWRFVLKVAFLCLPCHPNISCPAGDYIRVSLMPPVLIWVYKGQCLTPSSWHTLSMIKAVYMVFGLHLHFWDSLSSSRLHSSSWGTYMCFYRAFP